ncbi:MAG: hypothetical protein M1118_07345 [Chloroflexi bacterium]|nr:hypothetical protein [Chloroflexota bacterium]
MSDTLAFILIWGPVALLLYNSWKLVTWLPAPAVPAVPRSQPAAAGGRAFRESRAA